MKGMIIADAFFIRNLEILINKKETSNPLEEITERLN